MSKKRKESDISSKKKYSEDFSDKVLSNSHVQIPKKKEINFDDLKHWSNIE